MSKTWKTVERKIAAKIGGRRISNHALGQRTPDCESDWLSVEVKHRKRFPAWLTGALAQAARNATAGHLAVAVLHQTGQRYDDALVVMRLSDFLDWFGEVSGEVSGDGLAGGEEQ